VHLKVHHVSGATALESFISLYVLCCHLKVLYSNIYMLLFQYILRYSAECFSLQYTESNVDVDHLSFKSHIVRMVSMSNEENVLDTTECNDNL
jgi:hypothetical protein